MDERHEIEQAIEDYRTCRMGKITFSYKSKELVNPVILWSMGIVDPPHGNDRMSSTDDKEVEEGPVTLIVTRRAKAGKIEEFERWLDDIIHEAMRFEGHMGVNIIRPPNVSNLEYVIILRFDNFENLAKWEKSEIRKKWIEKGRDLTEGKAKVEKQTGLEFWFTPVLDNVSTVTEQQQQLQQPPRYKMAIVVTGIIFILASVLIPQVEQATVGLPILLSTFVSVAIMVLLMTYVIMPSLTRLLRPWLLKKQLF
jgi:antibiotic biosynthesis monooxygenase (ABM) superfamily enzyme